MDGYTTGQTMMMQLGGYQFGIATAAYQELQRTSEYRWPSQDRFGQAGALQFTGVTNEAITLQGVVYPEYRGGGGQLDTLRALAAQGQPQLMVAGNGTQLGRWVIEAVDERQGTFAAEGLPRRQEFVLKLRKFDDVTPEPASLVDAVAGGVDVGVPADADLSTLAGAKSAVAGMAQSVSDAASSVMGAASGAIASVRAAVAPAIDAGQSALGAINRSFETARDLKRAADSTVRQVQTITSVFAAGQAAHGLFNKAVALSSGASSATSVLTNVMGGASGAGGSVMRVLASARAASAQGETVIRKTMAASSDLYDKLTS
ncbi:hypothetical protein LMG31506_02989 [Cupriavidus yeoncheonensis]|uniref:Phage tail protein n=1 Tax=Cupriavidus yeoncheonensis TaxID=1462994 RepID=A0A916IUF2_9BURK|nr:phage tail protein [Cupriavidus yeoncheonensis]CAG2144359.1 hypothetical protein LMG31506_02989 [Cupriavidus yeoncheonensis]